MKEKTLKIEISFPEPVELTNDEIKELKGL